jgi:hypothetical protein
MSPAQPHSSKPFQHKTAPPNPTQKSTSQPNNQFSAQPKLQLNTSKATSPKLQQVNNQHNLTHSSKPKATLLDQGSTKATAQPYFKLT